MKRETDFLENNRRLTAAVSGTILGERVSIDHWIRLHVAGKLHHPTNPDIGAAVESLIKKNANHGARLHMPVVIDGRNVETAAITATQYEACTAWLEAAKNEIRAALTAEIGARPEIKIEWGGPAGFASEETRRGKLIEAELTLAGIKWKTDWDLRCPHTATLPRAQWLEIEASVKSSLDHENRRIEAAVNNRRSALNVQLWEPCDKCGAEPSYHTATGLLCENCQH